MPSCTFITPAACFEWDSSSYSGAKFLVAYVITKLWSLVQWWPK